MNKLETSLNSLGLGDGEGNVSSQRVFGFIIIAAIVVTRVAISFRTGLPMDFSGNELGILGIIFGGGVAKNVAENLGKRSEEQKTPMPVQSP